VRIDWRPAAARDVASLREYIDEQSPAGAEATVRRIFMSAESLMQFPRRGRSGQLAGTRELVVPGSPYVVIYRVDGDVIVILRVIHGAQRWPPA
jgi:toxin ParE1/3/4